MDRREFIFGTGLGLALMPSSVQSQSKPQESLETIAKRVFRNVIETKQGAGIKYDYSPDFYDL